MPIYVDPLAPPPAPPTTITSPDTFLTATLDSVYSGVLLKANLSSLTPDPKWILFYRVDADGTISNVRSGDLARSPGGRAVAYDHEAPLGVSSTWYIMAYNADGTTSGPYGGVGMTVPAAGTGIHDPSTWIKSLDDPNLSMRFPIVAWGDFNLDVFAETAHVTGRRLPVGAFDSIGGLSGQPTFAAYGLQEFNDLKNLIDSAQLLVQVAPVFNRPQFYALCTGAKMTTLLHPKDGFYGYQLELVEIDRPDTLNQGLRVPGKTYADRLATYPLYSNVPVRTYGAAL